MASREEFEQWWASTMPAQYRADALRLLVQSRQGDGKYGLIKAQDAWEGWQAARRTAPDSATLDRIRELATCGMSHGLLADDYCRQILEAIKTAPAAPDREAWISAKDRVPDSGHTVLATYRNRLGKLRRIRAQYVAPKTREQNYDCDELEAEYDEERDAYYWKAGWYECIDNWSDYSHVAVCEGEVTHWTQMPPAPTDAEGEKS